MKYWLLALLLIVVPAWATPAHFSKGITVSGTAIADHFVGDGSGLTGVSGAGGGGDKIVSGSTSIAAISASSIISVTAGGLNVMNVQSKTVTVNGTVSATTMSNPGVAKAWVVFNGNSSFTSTTAILASYNVQYASRTTTGNYNITFANSPFSNGHYAIASMTSNDGNVPVINVGSTGACSTVTGTCVVVNNGPGGALDRSVISLIFFGN